MNYALVGLFIVLLSTVIFLFLRFLRRPDPMQERLQYVLEEREDLWQQEEEQEEEDIEQTPTFVRPMLTTAGRFLMERVAPSQGFAQIDLTLERAGRPVGSVAEYLGLRLVLALALTVIGAMVSRGRPLTIVLVIIAIFGALGWWLPAYFLQRRITERKQAFWRDFLDALDLLALCVNAGQSLDASMARVVKEWPGPVANEFQRVNSEILLGESRREAFLSMAQRVDVPEISSFVSVLVQAEQVGGSISNLMLEQAEDIRIVRRQRAEELAKQAGIKMLFPLAFCMIPALMAILLGPAVPQMLELIESF